MHPRVIIETYYSDKLYNFLIPIHFPWFQENIPKSKELYIELYNIILGEKESVYSDIYDNYLTGLMDSKIGYFMMVRNEKEYNYIFERLRSSPILVQDLADDNFYEVIK